jgi:putative Holliday junction resolvase
MRYLGIDYGTKKVGLALSDEAGTMGFPHGILANDAALQDAVTALIKEREVGAIVIGESLDLSGAENPVAKDARAFVERLAERTGVPVHFESEVFTSALARRQHDSDEKSRAPKNRSDVDASAAALILTSYLSKQHGA